jgi:hypothetical protein
MRHLIAWGLAAILVLAAGLAGAAEDSGQFTELQGKVSVKKTNGQIAQAVLGAQVHQGDVVTTEKDARATLLFGNGSVLKLGPSSTLNINQLIYDKDKGVAQSAYELASGTLMNIVGSVFGEKGNSYSVKTPTAVAGVRGTINVIKVAINPQTGKLTTLGLGIQGDTSLGGSGGGSCTLTPGTYGTVTAGGGCAFQGPISEQDLQDLLANFSLGNEGSLDDRARDLRNLLGINLSSTGDRWYLLPDFLTPSGTYVGHGDDDEEDLMQGSDNPSDFISQEPPQLTDLIIIVNLP